MTDYEIILYFKNAKGNTCGRFRDDQLNKKYEIESKKRLNWYKYFLQILIPTLFFTARGYSQGQIKSKPTVCITPIKQDKKDARIILGGIGFVQDAHFILGKITDKKGRVLPGASIVINGTKTGTSSDEEGNFFLETTQKFPIRISVSYVGYGSKEILVDEKKAASSVNVVLNESIMGEVVVTGYVGRTRMGGIMGSVIVTETKFHEFTRKVADTFKTAIGKPSIMMYPNPLPITSYLTIELSNSSGDHKIEIFDMNGRLVQVEQFNLSSSFMQKQIRLKNGIAAGTYAVYVYDPGDKRISSQKLIVKY
jgi:hypothetical protein